MVFSRIIDALLNKLLTSGDPKFYDQVHSRLKNPSKLSTQQWFSSILSRSTPGFPDEKTFSKDTAFTSLLTEDRQDVVCCAN